MPSSYTLQNPLRKLLDQLDYRGVSAPADFTREPTVIDLGGEVYYFNGATAQDPSGITYGPVQYLNDADKVRIKSSFIIKNGVIILYDSPPLTDEGDGIFSIPFNSELTPEPRIHDPGAEAVLSKPRVAVYPAQRDDVFTEYNVHELAFNTNGTVGIDTTPIYVDVSETQSQVRGIFLHANAPEGVNEDVNSILSEIVADEPSIGTTADAAIGTTIIFKGLANTIQSSIIFSYENSAQGTTLGFTGPTHSNSDESANYVRGFVFLGRKTFTKYGATGSKGVSSYSPSYSENKIYYAPASGTCSQLFRSLSGVTKADGTVITDMGTSFIEGQFKEIIDGVDQSFIYDTDASGPGGISKIIGANYGITFENLEFIGEMKSRGGSGRSLVDRNNGGFNLHVKGCTFHKGYTHVRNSVGYMHLENVASLYPTYSCVGFSPVGGCLVEYSKFIGPEEKTALRCTSNDQGLWYDPKTCEFRFNYLNVYESNHGQAISPYAMSWGSTKIWGNIFHNCQRSVSFQTGTWDQNDMHLNGLRTVNNGVNVNIFSGLTFSNNLIYIDRKPFVDLAGQAGMALIGDQQGQLILKVDQSSLSDLTNNSGVNKIYLQNKLPSGEFQDYNFSSDIATYNEQPDPSNPRDYSFVNESILPGLSNKQYFNGPKNWSNASGDGTEAGRDASTTEKLLSPPRINNGFRELWVQRNSDQLSNFFLKRLLEEDNWLRLETSSGETFAYGITLEGVDIVKNSAPFYMDRNTHIMGTTLSEMYGLSFEYGRQQEPTRSWRWASYANAGTNSANNGLRVSLSGSQDQFDRDNDGNNDVVNQVLKSGFNNPTTVKNNIFWNIYGVGLSAGNDFNNLDYSYRNRRFLHDPTYQDNVSMVQSESPEEAIEHQGSNEFFDVNQTTIPDNNRVLTPLLTMYPNINSLSTNSLVSDGEYVDKGVVWTTDGSINSSQSYPVLKTLDKNIDLNWAKTHVPVDLSLESNSTVQKHHLVFDSNTSTVYMSVWNGTDWSVYQSDSNSGLTKEFSLLAGPGGISSENDTFVISGTNPGNPSNFRDYDG